MKVIDLTEYKTKLALKNVKKFAELIEEEYDEETASDAQRKGYENLKRLARALQQNLSDEGEKC